MTKTCLDDSLRTIAQFDKPIEEIYDGIKEGPVLGVGITGDVRKIRHKETGHEYALKVLDIERMRKRGGQKKIDQFREEINVMCELNHPNIVRLEEVYESKTHFFLVQALCTGGELFDRLEDEPQCRFSERNVARIVKQIASAVAYIHSRGIVHRDLKLENFLFETEEEDSNLVMIDFGLSKHIHFNENEHEPVGTPYTVAPEVIRGDYDTHCDVWAIGVITYMLLCGDPPFGGCGGPESLQQIRANILTGSFKFGPDPIWSTISDEALDFIEALLVTDPQKRPTSMQCLHMPWLKRWSLVEEEERRELQKQNSALGRLVDKEKCCMGWLGDVILSVRTSLGLDMDKTNDFVSY